MSKSKLDLDFFKKEVFMAPKTVAIIMDGNIKKLKELGILIRHGSPKNGYWEVTLTY